MIIFLSSSTHKRRESPDYLFKTIKNSKFEDKIYELIIIEKR